MYINSKTLQTAPTKAGAIAYIKDDWPGLVLPRDPSNASLEAYNWFRAVETDKPTGDVVTQGQPEQDSEGVWRQTWEVRDYTAEEDAAQLASAKADAQRRVDDEYEAELNAILSDYPNAETKTWDKQESEARAYQADSSAPTPLIDAIATARDMDKAELVQRVIAKADAWIALSGAATGKRQALEDAIASADTFETVEAISW